MPTSRGSGELSERGAHMRGYLNVLVLLTCPAIAVPNEGYAQGPQTVARNVQVWSNRTLSLRPSEFASSPPMENSPRAPSIPPDDRSGEQLTRMLLCEPDSPDPTA